MSAQLEELAFQLWMRFGGRSFCATEENLRKNWQSLHSTPYWLKQAAELQAVGVGVREAEPPLELLQELYDWLYDHADSDGWRREAGIFAGRLNKYLSKGV